MPDEIFVFGSNLAGIHGAGAAKTAHELFRARKGRGFGPTGQCYAIPTKDSDLSVLPLSEIKQYVEAFLMYAEDQQNLTFLVTEIGCGLAGYRPKQIAPMFFGCTENVILPRSFHDYLISRS